MKMSCSQPAVTQTQNQRTDPAASATSTADCNQCSPAAQAYPAALKADAAALAVQRGVVKLSSAEDLRRAETLASLPLRRRPAPGAAARTRCEPCAGSARWGRCVRRVRAVAADLEWLPIASRGQRAWTSSLRCTPQCGVCSHAPSCETQRVARVAVRLQGEEGAPTTRWAQTDEPSTLGSENWAVALGAQAAVGADRKHLKLALLSLCQVVAQPPCRRQLHPRCRAGAASSDTSP